MERGLHIVSRVLSMFAVCVYNYIVLCIGIEVTCLGNPGHGSRFIENTAVEKVVSSDFFYKIIYPALC